MISLNTKLVKPLIALLITDCTYGKTFTKSIPGLLVKKLPERDFDDLIFFLIIHPFENDILWIPIISCRIFQKNARQNDDMNFGFLSLIITLLGIGLFMQIDVILMSYLGVCGEYVGGIAKTISLP